MKSNTFFIKRNYGRIWSLLINMFLVWGLIVLTVGSGWAQNSGPAQHISIRSILEKNEFRLAEPFEFKVEITWTGDLGDFQIDPPKDFNLEGLAFLESSNSSETSQQDGRYVVRRLYRYHLTPLREGAARIGPVSFTYRQKLSDSDEGPVYSDNQTLATTPMTLNVLSPQKRIEIPWVTIGSIVAFVIFISIFIWFLKRKKKYERPVDDPVQEKPDQLFLEAVAKEEHALIDGDIRGYFVTIEKAFYQFILEQTKLNLSGKQVDEMVERIIEYVDSESEIQSIRNFLETTHLVKFAGHHPEQEEIERLVRALGRSVKAIRSTPSSAADNQDSV